VRCSPQAGLFFPPESNNLALQRLGVDATMNVLASLYLTDMFSSHLDASCVAYTQTTGEHKSRCWDSSYLTPHISTPLLAAQNMWDQLQIDTLLCFQDNLDHVQCPRSYLTAFKNHTVHAYDGLDNVGYFIPSCNVHTDNLCLYNDGIVTKVQGNSYLDVLTQWYESPDGISNPPRLIDDCKVKIGEGWKACNDVCSMSCG
jgi:hypothetical protein